MVSNGQTVGGLKRVSIIILNNIFEMSYLTKHLSEAWFINSWFI